MEKINPTNDIAFTSKEQHQIIKGLQQLKMEKNVVIETPPEIYDILGRIYQDAKCTLKNIEYLGDNSFKLGFLFPEKNTAIDYQCTQETLARFQAFYTVVGLALKNPKDIVMKEFQETSYYEIYLRNLLNGLNREYAIKCCKPIQSNKMYYLTTKISQAYKKGNFYIFNLEYLDDNESILSGTEKCLMEDRFVSESELPCIEVNTPIPLEQTEIVAIPPEIQMELGNFFNNSDLKSIEKLEDESFLCGFIFPKYDLTKQQLTHVSGVQMASARLQSLIAIAKLTGYGQDIIAEITKNFSNAIMHHYHITHSQIGHIGKMCYLRVKLQEMEKGIAIKFLRDPKCFLYGEEIFTLK